MADAIDGQTRVVLNIPIDDCTKRSFTVIDVRKYGKNGEDVDIEGKRRYLSNNPAGATKKAATRIIREVFGEDDDNCVVYLVMQETTKGSKKNTYEYTATRSISTSRREIAFGGAKLEGEGAHIPVGFRYDIRLKSERIASKVGGGSKASSSAAS